MNNDVEDTILQYGDIIQIIDPTNDTLNNNIFMVDYISPYFMRLIGKEKIIEFDINDGIIGNNTITEINIISRATSPSYAIQNNLITGKWINIYFSGDIPLIIVGVITNLENDVIEVKTIDNDTIYINFNYYGIPLDLDISEIKIREKPSSIEQQRLISKEEEKSKINDEDKQLEQREETEEVEEPKNDEEYEEDEENVVNIENYDKFSDTDIDIDFIKDNEDNIINSNKNKKILDNLISKANQITFGKIVGPITQKVEVSENEYVYGIDEQLNDLLNNLINNIPKLQQNPNIINNIHINVLRYKQLRELYSEFDNYNNIIGKKRFYEETNILQEQDIENEEDIEIIEKVSIIKSKIKPLKENLLKFKKQLYWIILVANNVKKVYDIIRENDNSFDDIQYLETFENITELASFIQNYKSNNANNGEIENKYNELIKNYDDFFIPFENLDQENVKNIIYQDYVKDNFDVMIDVDRNLDSYYVTNNVIKMQKYLFQRYNTGNMGGDGNLGNYTDFLTNDLIEISSIITLPEPVLRFSKINLPNTNILDRSNLGLNFINYWKIFNQKLKVENIVIDDFNNNKINFIPETYLNETKKYSYIKSTFTTSTPQTLDTKDLQSYTSSFKTYSNFLNTIIPEIKTLFNLVKKNISGKLSVVSVLDYLEPFLIYSQDLGFMQYKEITEFINKKIFTYLSSYYEKGLEFGKLKRLDISNSRNKIKNIIYELIRSNINLKDKIFSSYDYLNTSKLTSSELLKIIILKDYGRLYNTVTSLENLSLMISNNLNSIFNKETSTIDKSIKNDTNNNNCKNYSITKIYTSKNELTDDNYKNILFYDKKYDKTDYSIIDKYRQQQILLTQEEFFLFLTIELIKKYKYTEEKATDEAETLILGSKKIKDGDYAIFYDGIDSYYYIRENGKWVFDETISYNTDINGNNPNELLCNIQDNCIYKGKTDICESLNLNKDNIEKGLINEIMNEFNDKYNISRDSLKEKLNTNLEYYFNIFSKLTKIETFDFLKYNLQKYNIGTEILIETPTIISPYAKALGIILGNGDVLKKNNDILIFCNHFTREAIPTKIDIINRDYENIHWRYCIKTDVKLIPTFLLTLSIAYIENRENYTNVLNKVVKEIGTISDDGDCWVDKYSGYKIMDSDFDTEEGYDVEGFKMKTRDIIEEDFTSENIIKNQDIKTLIQTPENKVIINIVNTITNNMGINIDGQIDFILYNVKNLLKIIVPYTKEEYALQEQESAKKGKKIKSYKDVVNTTIMYCTLSLILISIQVNIPSIKTKKTFPGCIRSFDGFPVYNDGDFSALNYIACVAFNSRSSQEPWNVFQKQKQENIAKSIKMFIDEYLLKGDNNETIKRKIDEKLTYINYTILNKIEEIPIEHDIRLWTNFLPPLVIFKLVHIPENITSEFKSSLSNEIKNGSSKQTTKINVIKTKIIYFSLFIQELIQNIVNKKKLLLTNSMNEPFMDNSCCNDSKTTTVIEYFNLENGDISNNINQVIKLTTIIKDLTTLKTPPLYYCIENNKMKYPPIKDDFSDEIVYRAFIIFCNFYTPVMPIPNELLSLCDKKPVNLNKNDTMENQIVSLKQQGFEYNNKSLLRLLQIIGRNNFINSGLVIENEKISIIDDLITFLTNFDPPIINKKYEIIDKELPKLILELIPSYDTYDTKNSTELRNIYNFLLEKNENLKIKINNFIKISVKKQSEYTKISNFINNLIDDWVFNKDEHNVNLKTSDDEQYIPIRFIQDYIKNFIKIFPNMILNKVFYNNIVIQKYLKLSPSHQSSIKEFVNDYYKTLYKFYDDKTIHNILRYINDNLNVVIDFLNVFPSMSAFDENKLFNNFNKRISMLINEYFFLFTISFYIDLIDRNDMIDNSYTIIEEGDETYETNDAKETGILLTDKYIDTYNDKTDVEGFQNKQIIQGNKTELRKKISSLIVSYLNIMMIHKNTINRNYTEIMNSVFKEKIIEKNNITDNLSSLTVEERKVNTTLKINKLGDWGKGLRKGLVVYDKDVYDEEIEEMKQIMNIENQMRETLRVNDTDIDNVAIDEFINRQETDNVEDDERNNLSRFGEDFFNQYDGEELHEDDINSYN